MGMNFDGVEEWEWIDGAEEWEWILMERKNGNECCAEEREWTDGAEERE